MLLVTIIQIQHLLKLNTQQQEAGNVSMENSNTTLVKVKLKMC